MYVHAILLHARVSIVTLDKAGARGFWPCRVGPESIVCKEQTPRRKAIKVDDETWSTIISRVQGLRKQIDVNP